MSNDDAVLLDLNVPTFQKKLFELDAGDVKKVFKTFQKLQAHSTLTTTVPMGKNKGTLLRSIGQSVTSTIF